MADLGLTQADIDRLVPHLSLVLDMLVNPDEYEISTNKDFKDEDLLSNAETETDYNSVFDSVSVGVEAESVSSVTTEHALFAAMPPLALLPVVNPGEVDEENTVGDVAGFLLAITRRVTTEELQNIFQSANFPSPFRQMMWSKLIRLTMRPCEETGARHLFDQRQRCVRCSKQLCFHCRHSLLMNSQLYISSASAAQHGLQRKDSIAALRFHSVCDQVLCQDWIPDCIKRCECMEVLAGDRLASDTEVWGFFHCRECLENANLGLDMQNIRLVTFQTERGDEVLAEYICPCGRPVHPDSRKVCKICMQACAPYTLNAFDVFRNGDDMPTVSMRSLNDVNGGAEGQEEWNNGECLLFRRG